MDYGSPFYIVSLLFLLGITALIWAVLRKRDARVQRLVILALMLVNTFQHFFKSVIYPQYMGTGFTSISTAYNMCAFLIILSPVVFLWGGRFFKDLIFFVGSVAGIAAIAVPYWYIGMEVSELGWDYGRFYFCHAVLFVTSIMPLLLGSYRPCYKAFWRVGFGFIFALGVILVNDVICIALGLYPGADVDDLYGSLLRIDPCLLMGPSEELSWVTDVVRVFSPSVFLGNNATGRYAPILWYAVPLYLGITLIAFVLFIIADRKNFIADVRRLCAKKDTQCDQCH